MLLARHSDDVDMALSIGLELEQRVLAGGPQLAPGGGLVAQPDGVGRDDRLQPGKTSLAPGRHARLLGAQVPQGTVQRVASATRWQQAHQVGATDVVRQLVQHTGNLSGHAVRCLAVVVNPGCLGTTDMPLTVAQAQHQHRQVGDDLTGYLEGLGHGPMFDAGATADHWVSRAAASASTPPRIGSTTGRPSLSPTLEA